MVSINDISLEATGCLPTTISTIWNGSKTVNVNFQGGGYYLWDTCQASEIKMWDWNSTRDSGFIPSGAYQLNNVDNSWLETNQERLGTSSQWAIRNSYDYFKQIHGRNSYDNANGDVPINSYKENFKGHISFVSVDPTTGEMNIAFQLKTPGVNFDLARCGRAKSHGWFFFSCYNTEQANTLLEVNASQKDKDFIMAVNWKKAEEYLKAGKGKTMPVKYAHNTYNEATHTAVSKMETEVIVLDVAEL